MDVVPADEPDWSSDPFTLTDSGSTWTGRGTADMKGFLAVVVHRVRALDPSTLQQPLVLIFTYDEELGTLGAHDLVQRWPRVSHLPRTAIIGEPTSLHPVRMHKGHLKLRVQTSGIPAHSGYPHLGRNAIEPIGRAITALTALRKAIEAERHETSDSFGAVPFVAMNLATVAGGTAVNIVPDHATLDIGIRLLPRMTSGTMIDRVNDTLADALGVDQYTLEMLGDSPPMMVPDDSEFLGRVSRAAKLAPVESVSFATDAGWFQTVGMECVICGPGSIEVAHKPNEYVPKNDLAATEVMLTRLLNDSLT